MPNIRWNTEEKIDFFFAVKSKASGNKFSLHLPRISYSLRDKLLIPPEYFSQARNFPSKQFRMEVKHPKENRLQNKMMTHKGVAQCCCTTHIEYFYFFFRALVYRHAEHNSLIFIVKRYTHILAIHISYDFYCSLVSIHRSFSVGCVCVRVCLRRARSTFHTASAFLNDSFFFRR